MSPSSKQPDYLGARSNTARNVGFSGARTIPFPQYSRARTITSTSLNGIFAGSWESLLPVDLNCGQFGVAAFHLKDLPSTFRYRGVPRVGAPWVPPGISPGILGLCLPQATIGFPPEFEVCRIQGDPNDTAKSGTPDFIIFGVAQIMVCETGIAT